VARDPKYDVLFEPIRIGPKTVRNRFYQVPHCTGFGVAKPWSQARHRSTKAEGGWAAVCTEFAPISPETGLPMGASAHMWDEGDVRALSLLCDEAHAHGALAGIELHHGGALVRPDETRLAPIGPSPIAGDAPYAMSVVPRAMEKADIRRVQADWAAAAVRARSAGFDIVYVYGGHTFLPMQFLAPFYNQRTDEYGGSLENRARFWLETLEAVRDAVGDDCAIATRISVDEVTPATVDVEEALAFVALADHLVDLWDVNVGSIAEWGRDAATSKFAPEGHQIKWTGRVKEVSAKPVVGVSRWTSPDAMVEVIAAGKLDIIGAARPSIADPFLPRKIEEGRLDDVRECIGANQCIARVMRRTQMVCSQNATAGEEFRRGWHPERFAPAENADSDVLVLGAGPAGMECALVLARRGMRRVHLVDAEPELGGHLRWFSRLPGLGQWARIVNYRRIQLDKLRNVQFVPGTRLDAQGVRDYGADIVVLATGSHWSPNGLNSQTRAPLPGADATLPHVLTPEQVMAGKRPPGERVVVYDCEGYLAGPGLAEQLAAEGFRVELVTPYDHVSPLSDEALEGFILRRHLHDLGIALRDHGVVTAVSADAVTGYAEFEEPFELAADAVVLVTQRVSNDRLYHELAGDLDAALYAIGDCVSPRAHVADTIFDGHRLAREIDSEDPARALPYLREGAHDRVASPPLAAVD
jgi:dimethylamine/trimethylamine dehydrogenase